MWGGNGNVLDGLFGTVTTIVLIRSACLGQKSTLVAKSMRDVTGDIARGRI